MRLCISILLLLVSLLGATFVHAATLSHAPMVGAVDGVSAKIWIRADSAAAAYIQFQLAGGTWSQPQQSAPVSLLASNDFTASIPLNNLAPSTQYDYRVLLDGIAPAGGTGRFKTFAANGSASRFTFVFGASMHQSFRPHAIFDKLAAQQPDLAVILGNAGYSDVPAPALTESDFWNSNQITRDSAFQNFASRTPVFSVWNNNDYGAGNSDASYALKNLSRAAFGKYWANPGYVETNGAIYYKFSVGDVDFFMLDTRWNRVAGSTLLGSTQLQWLKSQLAGSTARFRFIVSPAMVSDFGVSPANGWAAFAAERSDLLQYLAANNIKNVVFLSGDQQWAGAFLINHPVFQIGRGVQGFPEYSSSPLSGPRLAAPRPNDPQVLFESDNDSYYGLARVDTTTTPRQVAIEIRRGSDDAIVYSTVIEEFSPVAAPTITTASLSDGRVNASYSISVTATGGVPPYQWSVVNGALPAGLTLSPSGVISGTPTQSGSFPFALRVQDAAFATSSRTLTLTVGANVAQASTLAGPSLTASPDSVGPGGSVTAAWSGIVSPTGRDWVGAYPAGAGDTSFVSWAYVNCSRTPGGAFAAGSCPFVAPNASGNFEFRLFANDGYNRLATSNTFSVSGITLPAISIAATDAIATEGSATDTGTFTVSRTGSTASPLTVFYSVGGTAINGTDYVSLPGSVTIPAGQSSAPILITTIDDSNVEGNETVVITLSANAAYTVGSPVAATVTIVDNDSPPAGPTLTASPASVAPGGTETANWSGIVNPSGRDWIGEYALGAADGSYQRWVYVNCSQTAGVALAAGSCPLAAPSAGGSYELRLFANDGYSRLATSNQFTVSVVTLPVVSLAVTDGSATEGSATDTGIFTVSRTGSTAAPLTVNYTVTGTATNGVDYQNLPGTVTIPANASSTTIVVTTIDDSAIEGNETVVVTLSASAAYTVGAPASGTVTIADNDAAAGPALTATPANLLPGGVVTATWSGIATPTGADWLALYPAGAGDGSYLVWRYVNCTQSAGAAAASGSCGFAAPTASGNYQFRLFANNGYSRLAVSNNFAVGSQSALIIASVKIPAATVNQAYNFTLAAGNGTPPYTWSLSSGTLPPGLSLTSAGVITGTALAPGVSTIGLQVQDSVGATATKNFAVTAAVYQDVFSGTQVNWQVIDEGTSERPSAWAIINGQLVQQSNIWGGSTSASDPVKPGTYAYAGNPNWTDYDFGVSLLSQDNDGIGIMFRYRDGQNYYRFSMDQERAYRRLTKTVNGVTSVLAQDSTPYQSNRWYDLNVAVHGNRIQVYLDGTLLFDVLDSSISSGVVGLYSWGNTGSYFDDVSVATTPLTVASTPPLTGTVGVPYNQALSASGGTLPYVWSLASGSLPQGLSLSPAGVVAGTPTAPGLANFVIQLRDGDFVAASQALSLTVNPATLTVAPALLPTGTVGTSYGPQNLSASGGVPPYVWSMFAGALPGGLTLSPTGAISGVPTASGSATFTVQVRDNTLATATRDFTIAVNPAALPLAIVTTTFPGAALNNGYNQTLVANGGTLPYLWSIVSGALPAGLTLAANGTISGTPTALGTANFTLQVSDAAAAIVTRAFSITVGGFSDTFSSTLANWSVVDEGTNSGPSDWVIVNGEVIQRSNIWGGTGNVNDPVTPGTYIVAGSAAWQDYTFSVRLMSEDNDGIGVMFRYQDGQNYYRFSMNSEHSFRRLVRVVNGVTTVLAQDNVPYVVGQWYKIRIAVKRTQIQVFVDQLRLFDVQDSSLSQGKIALFTWSNTNGHFDDVYVNDSGIFYLATNGDDNNPGTELQPFKTLRQAMLGIKRGDKLIIRQGEYKAGSELLAGSDSIIPNGFDDARTIIQAYPGESVVWRTYMPNNSPIDEITFRDGFKIFRQSDCITRYGGDGLWPTGCPSADDITTPYVVQMGLPWLEPVLQLFTPTYLSYIDFDGITFDARGISGTAISIIWGNHLRFMNGEVRNAIKSCINTPIGSDDPPPAYVEFINMKIHDCGIPYDPVGRMDTKARFWHGAYVQLGNFTFDRVEFYSNAGNGPSLGGGNTHQNNNVVRNSIIHDHYIQGLLITSGRDHVVENNLLYRNLTGVQLSGAQVGTRVSNNTIIGRNDITSDSVIGVFLAAGTLPQLIENNVITGVNLGVRMDNAGPNTLRNNLIYPSLGLTLTPLFNFGQAPVLQNNLIGAAYNANFVNPTGGNYRLLSGSSAIDSGYPNGLTIDNDGCARPVGATIDIGAYEYAPSCPLR